jgi:MYXO-CTERM domain-containing protein
VAAPLTPGKHYQLADATTCSFDPTSTEFTTKTITFTATAVAPLPTSLGATESTNLFEEDLQIATSIGSCDATVFADAYDVSIALATDAQPWKDVLMYATTIDGTPWSASGSLNGLPDPGTSWTGRGSDRVFEVCSGGDSTTSPGAPAGNHDVALHAKLPGTALALDATPTTISLICGAFLGDDLFPGGDAGGGGGGGGGGSGGGGCSASGTGVGAGAMFGLFGIAGILALRRRRTA